MSEETTNYRKINENDRPSTSDLLDLGTEELLAYVGRLEDAVTILWNAVSCHEWERSRSVPVGGLNEADANLWQTLDEVDELIFYEDEDDEVEHCDACNGEYSPEDLFNGYCTLCSDECERCGTQTLNELLEDGLCEDCANVEVEL